jgi:hypothetical protein
MKRLHLIIVLALLTPVSSLAWDSDVHTGLTQLTRNIIYLPGFWESEHLLVPATDAGKKCGEYRKETLAKDPARRVFLELVCGADDPDAERHFWQNDVHQKQAEKFAVDEFNAAVNAYREAGTKGASAYAEAANHLGRSLHFIQDLTDFSKGMKKRSDAREIRKRAKTMAQDYLTQWQTTSHYPPDLMAKLKAMHAEMQGGPGTPAELVEGALQQRAEMSDFFTQFLADPAEEGNRDYKMEQAIRTTLAGTIVIQEYWVDLYLSYIGVSK